MKKYNSLLLVVMFLVFTQGIFWSCSHPGQKKSSAPVIINVQYKANLDSLYILDSTNHWKPSHKHINKVNRGGIIIWQRIKGDKFKFESVTPDDSARNPFDKIIKTGPKLEVSIKPATSLDTGTYYYTVHIIYKGHKKPFDPILQIHH